MTLWLNLRSFENSHLTFTEESFGYSHYIYSMALSVLMLMMLLSTKAQACKDLLKPLKHCHVDIHWIA